MGFISFALKGNYKRYYGNLKELSKTTHKPAWFMFLDTAVCALRYGSALQDYLNYEFYNKPHSERKTYATVTYVDKVTTKLSNIKWSPYISNKLNFHRNYGKYTHREYFDPETGVEGLEAFLKKHPVFIYKPQIGSCGKGLTKMNAEEVTDKKAFYEQIITEKACVEELIKQHPDWDVLRPGCINTLRIVTGAANGKSWIMFACARLGVANSIADNFHLGGTALMIDMETGKITGNGIDKYLNVCEYSATGIKYDGFQVPCWEQVKELVLEAALVNDQIHFVGWDVALTPKCPQLIEGNRGPGFDIVQVLTNKGMKPMLEELVNEVERLEKEG